jgi:hypothetical protein
MALTEKNLYDESQKWDKLPLSFGTLPDYNQTWREVKTLAMYSDLSALSQIYIHVYGPTLVLTLLLVKV